MTSKKKEKVCDDEKKSIRKLVKRMVDTSVDGIIDLQNRYGDIHSKNRLEYKLFTESIINGLVYLKKVDS